MGIIIYLIKLTTCNLWGTLINLIINFCTFPADNLRNVPAYSSLVVFLSVKQLGQEVNLQTSQRNLHHKLILTSQQWMLINMKKISDCAHQ